MRVVLTTCSAEKHPQPEPLPAVQRYVHPRIAHAVDRARALSAPLCIFSGVYGLLAASDPVPWYDHALQPAEVGAATARFARDLRSRGIDELVAILAAREAPGWAPYHDVLEDGARRAGVRLVVEPWRSACGAPRHEEPHHSQEPEQAPRSTGGGGTPG